MTDIIKIDLSLSIVDDAICQTEMARLRRQTRKMSIKDYFGFFELHNIS